MHMHVPIRYCNTNLVLLLGKLVQEKLENWALPAQFSTMQKIQVSSEQTTLRNEKWHRCDSMALCSR